jgi:hypothetical protein
MMMPGKFSEKEMLHNTVIKLFPLKSYFWLEMSRWGNEKITQAVPSIIHTINSSPWGKILNI